MNPAGALIAPSLWDCDAERVQNYLGMAHGLPLGELILPVPCERVDQLLRDIPVPLRPRIRILSLRRQLRGRGIAVNLALAVASTEKVAVIDDDIVLSKITMQALWHSCTARTFATLRRVRAGSGRHLVSDSEIASVSHVIRFKPRGSAAVSVETSRFDLQRRGNSAPGAVCATRRALRAIGGMNAALNSPAWEMVDLLVRLQVGAGLRRIQTGVARLADSAAQPSLSAQQHSAAAYALASEVSIAAYWQGRFTGTFTKDLRRASPQVISWTPRRGWACETGVTSK